MNERSMPAVLWVAVVTLMISVLGKLVVALARPGMALLAVVGMAFGLFLLYGVTLARRWAYWVTAVGVPISCALAFLKGPSIGLATTALNLLIFMPVLMSRDYFLSTGQAVSADRQGGIAGDKGK